MHKKIIHKKFKGTAISLAVILTIFSGCGGSNNNSSTKKDNNQTNNQENSNNETNGKEISSSKLVADAYIIGKMTEPAEAICGDKKYTSKLQIGKKGKLTFPKVDFKQNSNCIITVKKDSILMDINNDGINNDTKKLTFNLTAPSNVNVITPITTLLVQKIKMGKDVNQLEKLILNFDHIAEIDRVVNLNGIEKLQIQKLLILTEILKISLDSGVPIKQIGDINLTTVLNSTVNEEFKNFNISKIIETFPLSNNIKAKVKAKTETLKTIIALLDILDTNKLKLSTFMVNISDGGKNIIESLIIASKLKSDIPDNISLSDILKIFVRSKYQSSLDTIINIFTSINENLKKINKGNFNIVQVQIPNFTNNEINNITNIETNNNNNNTSGETNNNNNTSGGTNNNNNTSGGTNNNNNTSGETNNNNNTSGGTNNNNNTSGGTNNNNNTSGGTNNNNNTSGGTNNNNNTSGGANNNNNTSEGTSDESNSKVNPSSKSVSDAYIIGQMIQPAEAICGNTIYKSNINIGKRGKLTFPKVDFTKTKNCIITVKKNSVIMDINNDNIKNETQKLMFDLKAPSDGNFITPLTTLLIEKMQKGENVTLFKKMILNFDPVAIATKVVSLSGIEKLQQQKLMLLTEIIKVSLSSGVTLTQIGNIDLTTIINTEADSKLKDFNPLKLFETLEISNDIKTKIKAKVETLQTIVALLDILDINKINLSTFMVNISDGGKNIGEALASSIKLESGLKIDVNMSLDNMLKVLINPNSLNSLDIITFTFNSINENLKKINNGNFDITPVAIPILYSERQVATNAYIIGKMSSRATVKINDTIYQSRENINPNGTLIFDGIDFSTIKDATITVEANSVNIDINSNGIFDSDDKKLGFKLSAPIEAKVISPLTTLLIQKMKDGEDVTLFKKMILNFNPVEASNAIVNLSGIEKIKMQKLMILMEIIRVSLNAGINIKDIAKIDLSTITTTLSNETLENLDISKLVANLPSNIRSKATAKAQVMKSIIQILDVIDPMKINISKFISYITLGGKTIEKALSLSVIPSSGFSIPKGISFNLILKSIIKPNFKNMFSSLINIFNTINSNLLSIKNGNFTLKTVNIPILQSTRQVSVGAYLIGIMNNKAIVDINGTIYKSRAKIGKNGTIIFDGIDLSAYPNSIISILPNSAQIDINNNGNLDNEDIDLSFELKAPSDAKFITPLTTLLVEKNAEGEDVTLFKQMTVNFNPSTSASNVVLLSGIEKVKMQKLMILMEIIRISLQNGIALKDIAKIDLSSIIHTANGEKLKDFDISRLTANLPDNIRNKVLVKAKSLLSIIELLDLIDPTKINLSKFMLNLTLGGKTIKEAFALSINPKLGLNISFNMPMASIFSSIAIPGLNIDLINKIADNLNTINKNLLNINNGNFNDIVDIDNTELMSLIPTKIKFANHIKFGSKYIYVEKGKPFTIVLGSKNKIQDFYNISFGNVKVKSKFKDQNISLNFNISDGNNYINLELLGVKVSTDENLSLQTKITNSTEVKLKEKKNGEIKIYHDRFTSEIVNNDLSFNLETVINALDNSNINSGLDKLNSYLKTTGKEYNISIEVNGLDDYIVEKEFIKVHGKLIIQEKDPVKLTSDEIAIAFGDLSVSLAKYTPFTLDISSNDKLSDFYNISILGAQINGEFPPQTIDLSIKVQEINKSNYVSLKLSDIILSTDDGISLQTKFTTDTSIEVEKNISGEFQSAKAKFPSELINNDLDFNMQTIIDTIDKPTLNSGLNKLNEYLKTPNKMYNFDMRITNLDPRVMEFDFGVIKGEINVLSSNRIETISSGVQSGFGTNSSDKIKPIAILRVNGKKNLRLNKSKSITLSADLSRDNIGIVKYKFEKSNNGPHGIYELISEGSEATVIDTPSATNGTNPNWSRTSYRVTVYDQAGNYRVSKVIFVYVKKEQPDTIKPIARLTRNKWVIRKSDTERSAILSAIKSYDNVGIVNYKFEKSENGKNGDYTLIYQGPKATVEVIPADNLNFINKNWSRTWYRLTVTDKAGNESTNIAKKYIQVRKTPDDTKKPIAKLELDGKKFLKIVDNGNTKEITLDASDSKDIGNENSKISNKGIANYKFEKSENGRNGDYTLIYEGEESTITDEPNSTIPFINKNWARTWYKLTVSDESGNEKVIKRFVDVQKKKIDSIKPKVYFRINGNKLNLTINNNGQSEEIELNANKSTDNVGIVRYKFEKSENGINGNYSVIYDGNNSIFKTIPSVTIPFINKNWAKTFYRVTVYDAAGNKQVSAKRFVQVRK